MQELPKDYEWSVCEVKTMDNELLVAGYISQITDEYIQIGTYKGDQMPLLKFDLPLKVSIHNTKKGFRVVAGTTYISTDEILRVVNVDNLQDFERRVFFRVPIKIPAKIFELNEFETRPADEPVEIPVMVENLSLSGLLFLPEDSSRRFLMGDKFIVELPMPKGDMNLNIRVCRYEQIGQRPQKYGCEFFGYTQKQSDTLCAYIFNIEREMIKKRKNVI